MKRKMVQVQPEVWTFLRERALTTGLSISDVIKDLISSQTVKEDVSKKPASRHCHLCGAMTEKFFCDDCYYDPTIVVPALFGFQFVMLNCERLKSGETPLTFDEFTRTWTFDMAIMSGVTEEEWEVWQQWLHWRQRHKQGEDIKNDAAFRAWVNKTRDLRTNISKRTRL